MNNYYVYEHIRLDNNTCFYVGKGVGYRCDYLYRNTHHDRISEKYGHAVVIIKDGLSEEEALELERKIIEEYVFDYGYGIDIDGYRNEDDGFCLTNATWGGEGVVINGGVYYNCEICGKEHYTNKAQYETSKHHYCDNVECRAKGNSLFYSGENNPFYGKSHTEETKQKISESNKGNIPWNKGLKGIYSDEYRQKIGESRRGKDNPSARKVICITTGKIFDTAVDGAKYYGIKHACNISQNCSHVKHHNSAGKLEDGTKLVWMYYDEYIEINKVV